MHAETLMNVHMPHPCGTSSSLSTSFSDRHHTLVLRRISAERNAIWIDIEASEAFEASWNGALLSPPRLRLSLPRSHCTASAEWTNTHARSRHTHTHGHTRLRRMRMWAYACVFVPCVQCSSATVRWTAPHWKWNGISGKLLGKVRSRRMPTKLYIFSQARRACERLCLRARVCVCVCMCALHNIWPKYTASIEHQLERSRNAQ